MSERWEWLNANVSVDDLCTMVCSAEEATRAAERRAADAEEREKLARVAFEAERLNRRQAEVDIENQRGRANGFRKAADQALSALAASQALAQRLREALTETQAAMFSVLASGFGGGGAAMSDLWIKFRMALDGSAAALAPQEALEPKPCPHNFIRGKCIYCSAREGTGGPEAPPCKHGAIDCRYCNPRPLAPEAK